MRIDVKLFARARELAGRESVQLDLPDSASVADVRAALAQHLPQMSSMMPSMLIAVGADYADDSKQIDPGMEVACIPPVSGG